MVDSSCGRWFSIALAPPPLPHFSVHIIYPTNITFYSRSCSTVDRSPYLYGEGRRFEPCHDDVLISFCSPSRMMRIQFLTHRCTSIGTFEHLRPFFSVISPIPLSFVGGLSASFAQVIGNQETGRWIDASVVGRLTRIKHLRRTEEASKKGQERDLGLSNSLACISYLKPGDLNFKLLKFCY